MADGSKSPTDVESPICATVVQLVLMGAGCAAIVLVVTVVVVGVVVVTVVLVEVAVEVLLATGADRMVVVVVGNAATGVATSRAAGVTADSASSAPRPTLHPKEAVASPTASTNGATRRGRATSRV
jgi:hypothetical protein